jgi:hypothetical protein
MKIAGKVIIYLATDPEVSIAPLISKFIHTQY